MSRRVRGSQSSSLDLFLDTICNTFGGIMFLAILLSVLVQMRSKQKEEPKPDSSVPVSSAEYEQIVTRLQTVSEQRSQLLSLVSTIKIDQPSIEDAELSQIQKSVEERSKKLDKAISDQQALATELAKQLKSNAQMVEEMDKIKKQLIEAQAALEVETKALDKALDDQMEVLKLPQVKSSNKRNLVILMRYGKVYFLMNELSVEPDDKDIAIVKLAGGSFTANPKQGSGYRLPENTISVEKLLRRNSPGLVVYSVIVWPDSFAEFAGLKNLLINIGFQYDLQPITDLPSCPFTRGASSPRVQ
jgi:hypothetical protein